jgi:hypothetical protein
MALRLTPMGSLSVHLPVACCDPDPPIKLYISTQRRKGRKEVKEKKEFDM